VSIAPKDPKEAVPPEAAATASPEPEEKPAVKKEKPPKPSKEGKGKPPKPTTGPIRAPKKGGKPVPDNPNFRYIVRLADSDLDGQRATALALSGIRGVGIRTAEVVCHIANVNPTEMIGNLPEPTVEGIEAILGDLPQRLPAWMVNHPRDFGLGEKQHFIAAGLETSRRDDVNLMKMIRSYKGVRHERGQKVRGQRTRSNGRTGMAAGVLKKAAKEAAQAKEREATAAPAPAAAPAAAAAPTSPAKKA
jgi:small subunit ribosomal protein S13